MTSKEILAELATLGSPSIKKVLTAHGAREPFYGVKVEDLKKIMKRTKTDYKLSMELFDSGISDAMYLAGLIADSSKMTKQDLKHWADKAYWYMLSEYPVAWVTAESPYGLELALEWIDSDKPQIACAGWCSLGYITALKADIEIDIQVYKSLINRVTKEIHKAPNRVRYCMNGFLIMVGSYVTALTADAKAAGEKIGAIQVDMGGTACKVPDVTAYIGKVEARGNLGKKKKTVRC